MREIAILQPYLPDYRIPLFQSLASRLSQEGGSLTVIHGVPRGDQALRGDKAGGFAFSRAVRTANIELGPVRVTYKWTGSLRRFDVIVSELAVTSLNSMLLAWQCPEKTILWGHGRRYVTQPGRTEQMIRAFLARRAAHVMTYTDGGRNALIGSGLSGERVTTIGNSIDVTEIVQGAAEAEIVNPRGPKAGPVALYIGGLDQEKLVPFLLSAAREAAAIDPRFKLLVAGAGALQSLVEECSRDGYVTYLGRLSKRRLGQLALSFDAFWVPGRIGLVAVDALTLGKPILTTGFAFHGPEAELLNPGQDYYRLASAPDKFAVEALKIMARLERHIPNEHNPAPKIDEVAGRMAKVILDVMANSS